MAYLELTILLLSIVQILVCGKSYLVVSKLEAPSLMIVTPLLVTVLSNGSIFVCLALILLCCGLSLPFNHLFLLTSLAPRALLHNSLCNLVLFYNLNGLQHDGVLEKVHAVHQVPVESHGHPLFNLELIIFDTVDPSIEVMLGIPSDCLESTQQIVHLLLTPMLKLECTHRHPLQPIFKAHFFR